MLSVPGEVEYGDIGMMDDGTRYDSMPGNAMGGYGLSKQA
jgi:hypothetical protein